LKGNRVKDNQGNNISILAHLSELRSRLLKSTIAVLFTCIVAFFFATPIFNVLTRPASGINLIYIDMTEMLGIYMKVCLAAGIALAMPYLVYQIIMFVFPALTPKEKQHILWIIPWVIIMFAGGVIFSYFVLLPPAIKFLLTFGNDIANPQIRIGSYITLVTRILLASGIIFELPVITTFLARIGLVNHRWLAGKRKIAFVLAFILAAVITPTFDPLNQTLVAAPLIVLYEMSIWLAKLVEPRKVEKTVSISTA
jgi:sec-independent protein translocase protein TatC